MNHQSSAKSKNFINFLNVSPTVDRHEKQALLSFDWNQWSHFQTLTFARDFLNVQFSCIYGLWCKLHSGGPYSRTLNRALLYTYTCYNIYVVPLHVFVYVCVCVCARVQWHARIWRVDWVYVYTCTENHWSYVEEQGSGRSFQTNSIQLQIYYIIANIVTIYNKYSRLDYINKIYRIVSLGLQQHVTVNN